MPPVLRPHQAAAEIWQIDTTPLRSQFAREYPVYASNADVVEMEYRRFLHVKMFHADLLGLLFAPSPLVDLFWRKHASDPEGYSEIEKRTGVLIKYDAAANDPNHPTYARRRENTAVRYGVLIGCRPERKCPSVWGGRQGNGIFVEAPGTGTAADGVAHLILRVGGC